MLIASIHADETVTVSDARSTAATEWGLASLGGSLLRFCQHVRAFFVVSGTSAALRGVVIVFAQSARPRTTDAPLEKRNAFASVLK